MVVPRVLDTAARDGEGMIVLREWRPGRSPRLILV